MWSNSRLPLLLALLLPCLFPALLLLWCSSNRRAPGAAVSICWYNSTTGANRICRRAIARICSGAVICTTTGTRWVIYPHHPVVGVIITCCVCQAAGIVPIINGTIAPITAANALGWVLLSVSCTIYHARWACIGILPNTRPIDIYRIVVVDA